MGGGDGGNDPTAEMIKDPRKDGSGVQGDHSGNGEGQSQRKKAAAWSCNMGFKLNRGFVNNVRLAPALGGRENRRKNVGEGAT